MPRLSRIGLKLSLLGSLLVLGVVLGMTRFVLDQAREALVYGARFKAEVFAQTSAAALLPHPDLFVLHAATHQMAQEKGVAYAAVINPAGTVLSHSNPALIGSRITPAAADVLELELPVLASKRPLGAVRVGLTENSLAAALSPARQRLVIAAAAAAGLAALGIVSVVGWLMRPLEKLVDAAQRLGSGRLDTRVAHESADELGALSRAFNRMAAGLEERERLRGAFGRLVSPEIAELAARGELPFGGRRVEATVLLCDLREFTHLAENQPPEEVVALLNGFLTEMVEAVLAQGGVVDKFTGDGLLAVFGAPAAEPAHAAKACACALDMHARLGRLNAARAAWGATPLRMGVAVNTGTVVAGTVGCRDHMEYTVIGDAVNLVSRLEGLNARLGTSIVVAHSTMQAARERFFFRPLGTTLVRGRQRPVKVYEPLPADTMADYLEPHPAAPATAVRQATR